MLFIQAPCGQNKHYPSESYPPSTRIIAIKASQRVKFCPLFGISYRANNYERMRVGMLKKEQKVRPIIRKVTRSPPLLLRLHRNVALRTNSLGWRRGAVSPENSTRFTPE